MNFNVKLTENVKIHQFISLYQRHTQLTECLINSLIKFPAQTNAIHAIYAYSYCSHCFHLSFH